MIALIAVEARRDLSRWAIRLLIGLAVALTLVTSVWVYLVTGPDESIALTDIWPPEGGDGILLVAAFFLLIGGFFGGATVMGAEWKAGTMGTLLTWEPRRVRVALTKIGVAAAWAFVIALVLQVLFAAAFVPTILHVGSTSGADSEFWLSAVGAGLRIAAVTSIAAALGAALSLLGRNTALALGAVFGYIAVAEQVLRGLKPGWSSWFIADNIGRFMSARPLETEAITKSTAGAGLTLLAYTAVLVFLAVESFRRRDIAGTG